MALCGFAVFAGFILFLYGKRKKKENLKKSAVILCLAAFFGFLSGGMSADENLLLNGALIRPENGAGTLETELLLEIEGRSGKMPFAVSIPERRLTAAEEAEYLKNAVKEIEDTFPGNNPSVNEIRSKVVISDLYQQGKVEAEWEFGNVRLIDADGTVRTEYLTKEGEAVRAAVRLRCEDSEMEYEFFFSVYAPKQTGEERLHEEILKEIEKNGIAEGVEQLKLPNQVGGYRLIWEEKAADTPLQILFVGALLAIMLPVAQESRKKEKQKKREERLLLGYPDMVSKLTLLLGAGMTLSGAWIRITENYLKARKNNLIPKQPVYEEMIQTVHEMAGGIGEAQAYERFGRRCGISKYRKLGNILSQNLKKGSQGLSALLESEAGDVFEERKSLARKYGEEAGTKLLLPMMIMFGVVVFIIMVPAVISFQI